jgi:hypothetical protein
VAWTKEREKRWLYTSDNLLLHVVHSRRLALGLIAVKKAAACCFSGENFALLIVQP